MTFKKLKLWWYVLVKYIPLASINEQTLSGINAFLVFHIEGQAAFVEINGIEYKVLYSHSPKYTLIFHKLMHYLFPDTSVRYIADLSIHKVILQNLITDYREGKLPANAAISAAMKITDSPARFS